MFKVERISARTGSVQCKRGLIPVGSTARVQVPAIASLDGEGSQDAGPIGTRSISIRFSRSSTASLIVCPCTTTQP